MVILSNQQARNLKNRNVRLALGYALNRKDMVNKVLGNGSKTPLSGVPQDFMTYKGKDFAKASHTKNATTYDKKKAQKLWNKGLKELGKSGQKVELTLLGDDDDTTKSLNEYI
ncbi:ABC transporter substrate-binding protein [Ligilactobacillus ruminis]|uniref:ABC transporter substrate-binding protein n=1 Tax=Ligilactobacillus ruminis TaxID=1623 RepID=UPI003F9D2C8A